MIQPSGSQSRAQEKGHLLNKEELLAVGGKGTDGRRGQSLLPARSLGSQRMPMPVKCFLWGSFQ